MKKTHEEFVKEMKIANPNVEIIGLYTKSSEKIKCKCLIDGYEWESVAADLLRGHSGCSVCSGKKLIPGFTDIPSKAPWMVEYFQGGYDEAKKYTVTSTVKIKPKCPKCGRIKANEISIASIYSNHSIGCVCSDGISYPNKFGFSFLEQLLAENITPEYCPDWIKPLRYDFYFEYKNEKYILEMDGGLGHGKKLWDHTDDINGLKNDEYKEEMALQHGIKVIRIEAEKSNVDYIKNSIINNNDINKIFKNELNSIDWNLCDKFAQKSILKEVCDYWETGSYKLLDLANIFKVSIETIRNYLKKGESLGFCDYYSKVKKIIPDAQPLICNDKYIFISKNSLIRNSEKLFNIKLSKGILKKYKEGEFEIKNLNIKLISLDDFLFFKSKNPELCFT